MQAGRRTDGDGDGDGEDGVVATDRVLQLHRDRPALAIALSRVEAGGGNDADGSTHPPAVVEDAAVDGAAGPQTDRAAAHTGLGVRRGVPEIFFTFF